MDREQRQELRATADEVARRADRAQAIVAHRNRVEKAAGEAVESLRDRTAAVQVSGSVAWRAIPLRGDDSRALVAIAKRSHLPTVSTVDESRLEELTSSVPVAVHDVKSVVGARRFFSGSKKKSTGASASDFLSTYRTEELGAGLPEFLDRLSRDDGGQPDQLPVEDALTDWVGLRPHIGDLGDDPEIRPVSVIGRLADSIASIDAALHREQRFRDEAKTAGAAVRKSEVRKLMREMPVERLKDATRDRLRIGPLTDVGIKNIQAVLDRGTQLEHLPGIGATTAARIRGAAQTLWQTTYEGMPVRIDIKARTSEGAELLRRLGAWEAMRKTKGATTDLALKDALAQLAKVIDKKVTHLVVVAAGWTVAQFEDAVLAVNKRAAQIAGNATGSAAKDSWEDFLARPADYFAMLSELGFVTENEEKSHGDLPDDIVEAVRSLELNTQHLTASLRGYQSFARFALTQRKVVIGDEMGLGKTVEAIAVLSHLRAQRRHHSLVICPAAVVTNWVREIQSKSSLRPHRVHGPGREAALRNWVRNGGVAVTTYEGIHFLGMNLPAHGDLDDVGCVVVDEAHYIKNPAALRSQRVAQFVGQSDYSILLTGTPLENRIDEFRNLVGYLRPDLVIDANELAPRRFRRQVAPAYLRRNQEDVLTELPELVEVNEWLPMSSKDEQAYRDAVYGENFMAMRQAAMASGNDSEKMRRLIEIVAEAEDNGRRVIVFSHFRNVLDQVAGTLPGKVFGPLTGSVPAAARQTMVDQFSAAGHGAVQVSQIIAGGIGLNIQAASVVVICEPQLKPTTEWQAIARARRMGQLETVQVHRLLSEDGVDQRITEILARKKEIFDDFARVSDTAESAPEAFDISEAELAREVVAAERERLFNQANAEPGEEAAD
ncbi:DEAD/DEAH box helicase [Rudaeicoccus suwonensis]|uniref:SNF2 domain-containing protein n=1 Tax=Rudaeicoccus suwonensis TaxID=657409 RepID=A0A561EC42_9MICO|nr:DEAD/DEAH box helicase [Rudaeicoccus suwonensis]TWE13179.1 SNF2 domain-containing protein [Rudaeicoccus suwonensis]